MLRKIFICVVSMICLEEMVLGQTSKIEVINPLDLNRTDELIVLNRSMLNKKLGNIPKGKFITVSFNAKLITVQFDDLDGDKIWDEALFLYSFRAKEKVFFTVRVSNKPAFFADQARAHVRQRHKLSDNSFGESLVIDTMPYNNKPTDFLKQRLPFYLTEGPAWENDKVGFRKYFDTRNANDLWGKTTDKMVMDIVGVNPDSIYHQLSWWGMDILKVGSSLGAGAIALKIKLPDGSDTLIRMGNNSRQTIYQQIANGPVRAMFRIMYKDCKVKENMRPITISETISIWGGQYFFSNEVEVSNAPEGTQLVTGIPDFYECRLDTISSSSTSLMYTFGKQSENNDLLTMAVMLPRKNYIGVSIPSNEKTDIKNTYLVNEHLEDKKKIGYRFYSLWQLSDAKFSVKNYVISFLEQQSFCYQHPLIIK